MKKLITILATLIVIAQPNFLRANDEWSMALTTPLALTGGALIICACYIHKQAGIISRLEQDVSTKKELLNLLTEERDSLVKERDEKEKSISTWNLILNQFRDFIPFLCTKESEMPPAYTGMLDKLGFERSTKKHKITGLTTFISRSPNFTNAEKNLVSDEEDSLEEREQVLSEIGSDVTALLHQIDGEK